MRVESCTTPPTIVCTILPSGLWTTFLFLVMTTGRVCLPFIIVSLLLMLEYENQVYGNVVFELYCMKRHSMGMTETTTTIVMRKTPERISTATT